MVLHDVLITMQDYVSKPSLFEQSAHCSRQQIAYCSKCIKQHNVQPIPSIMSA